MAAVNEKRLALENENKTLRVLVVGPTGCGKSSFIDSISSTLCNDIIFEATNMDAACGFTDSTVSTTEKVTNYSFPLFPSINCFRKLLISIYLAIARNRYYRYLKKSVQKKTLQKKL